MWVGGCGWGFLILVLLSFLFGLTDDFRPLRTSLLASRSDINNLSTSRVIPAILSEERHILNMSKRTLTNPPSDSIRHGSHTAAASASAPTTPASLIPQLQATGPERTRRTYDSRQHPYYRNSRPCCAFCLGFNHSEVQSSQSPATSSNATPLASLAPTSSLESRIPPSLESRIAPPPPRSLESRISLPSSESANHATIMNPTNSIADSSLRFAYSYYAGPPGVGSGCGDWMLDSGTTSHFIKWKHLYRFFNLTPPIPIDTAGSSSLTGQAIGSVPLFVEVGEVILANVIYATHLHTNCNLLSMAALDADGLDITFSNRKAFITRRCDNVLWATGSLRTNSLYFFDTLPSESCNTLTETPCNALVDTQLLDTWHKRLGHLSARNITRLLGMSTCIKVGPPPTLVRNEDCLKSGQHRIPSHLPTRWATKKLQLIHSDICGPMRVSALGRKEVYFATVIDDFSRMTWFMP